MDADLGGNTAKFDQVQLMLIKDRGFLSIHLSTHRRFGHFVLCV